MQHFLKPASGTARAGVVAAEFLDQFLLSTTHGSVTALHPSLAQGTPGAASTYAQKQWRASSSLLCAILPPCRGITKSSSDLMFVATFRREIQYHQFLSVDLPTLAFSCEAAREISQC